MTKQLFCALAMIAAAAPALADHPRHGDGIDERQYRLQQRIEHGRAAGDLTRHEYRRLRYELHMIGRDERAYRSDGYLSRREHDYLNARLDALAREVYHERRDVQRRGSPHYSGPHYNDHHADRRF